MHCICLHSAVVDHSKAMQILAGKLDHPSWNFMGQEGAAPTGGCLATRVGDIIEVDFGSFEYSPENLNWDGFLAVHNGSMTELAENEWIRFKLFHREGGMHVLYLSYASGDSRPVSQNQWCGGTQKVACGVTGGFGFSEVRMDEEQFHVDLGGPNEVVMIEFRSEHFLHTCINCDLNLSAFSMPKWPEP